MGEREKRILRGTFSTGLLPHDFLVITKIAQFVSIAPATPAGKAIYLVDMGRAISTLSTRAAFRWPMTESLTRITEFMQHAHVFFFLKSYEEFLQHIFARPVRGSKIRAKSRTGTSNN